jgi:hypothetical protein
VSSPRRGVDLLVLFLLYVVPVGVAAVLLTRAGLGVLAVALLSGEAVVAVSVWAVRRAPEPARPVQPSRRPWLVPLVMLGALGLLVLVALVAAQTG